MKFFRLLVTIPFALGAPAFVYGEEPPHWNQFRGPNGAGVVESFHPPVRIVAQQADWKTPLPPGKSSPVVWEGRIFVTAVEGDRLATLALDAQSGRILWKQYAPEVELESVHTANSVASSTPCVDENYVHVYFGSYGLLCYDHEGNEVWKKSIPTPESMYGVSTSPVHCHEMLVLLLDDDANLPDSKLSRSKLITFDKASGHIVWETPRPFNRGGWSSPMIWRHEVGEDLVIAGNGRAYGYDPETGQEKWYVSGFSREPISLPVAGGGHLYVSVSMQGGRGDAELDPEPFWIAMLPLDRDGDGRIGMDEITEDFTLPFRPELPLGHPGFGLPLPADPEARLRRQHDIFKWRDKNQDGFWTREEFFDDMKVGRGRPNLSAIRPGGTGDITESHVRWKLSRGIPEIPSPIYHKDRLYLIRAGGVLSCVDAGTGDIVYRERLGAPGQYSASPVIANEHLYLVSDRGMITVLKTGDELQIVHQVDLEQAIAATPAMDQNSLYIRTEEALIAFR